EGAGWLICGPSGSGKTSITLAALRLGWKWLSDEWIFFSARHPRTMLGFRRNFNLKEHSFSRFPETAGRAHSHELLVQGRQQRVRFVDPEILAPGLWREEADLTGIIFPRFEPESGRVEVHRLESAAILPKLLPEIKRSHNATFQWLATVAASVPAFEVCYDDVGCVPSRLPSPA